MTIRPRAVRALKDARSKLRDLAAASSAAANDTRDQMHLAVVRECDKLEEYLDQASDELTGVRNVHELGRVAETTGVYRMDILDAEARRNAAQKLAEAAADRLRDSSRALRRAEKLEEHVLETRAKAEAVADQKLTDDLVSSRRR